MTIHWCGTGAHALPGLRRLLATQTLDVCVWTRTPSKAAAALGALAADIHPFDANQLGVQAQAGDVIVSMLPGDMHLGLATLAANKGVHFVCPGSTTPALMALHAKALLAHATLVFEAGFSPGIDHLIARHLMSLYREDPVCDPANDLSLSIRAGNLPSAEKSFRAGLGGQAERLLRALSQPARGVRGFQDWRVNMPWDAAETVTLACPVPEEFETLPRGDALPLLDLYACDPTWRISELYRGLLRPTGWTAAWGPVLAQLDTLNRPAPSASEMAMTATGGDRALISVSLQATRDQAPVWSRTITLNAVDNDDGSALARLVSLHVALVAETLAAGDWVDAGTTITTSDPDHIHRWLQHISRETTYFEMTGA